MGLWDLFSRQVNCPTCGSPGARSGFGRVKCPNVACPCFDEGRRSAWQAEQMKRDAGAERSRAARARWAERRKSQPVFDPVSHPVEFSYTNHRGEKKTFTADRRTLRRRGRHISMQIAPSGARMAFAMDRIGNLSALESILSEKR